MFWSHEEICLLRSSYIKGRSIVDIAKKLGRSINAVYKKAERLGIQKKRIKKDKKNGINLRFYDEFSWEKRRWLDEEEDFLKQNYYSLKTSEIANELGRTVSSVRNKFYRMYNSEANVFR